MSDVDERLDNHESRLSEVEKHVAVLRDAKQSTEQSISELERRQEEQGERHHALELQILEHYGNIDRKLTEELPRVANSVPKEVQDEFDKRLKRTHYKWGIVLTVLGIFALLHGGHIQIP